MSLPLEVLRGQFARHLRAEGKAERTVVLYCQSIRYFSDWRPGPSEPTDGPPGDLASKSSSGRSGQQATLGHLTREAILEWLESLTDSGLNPGTIRTRYRGLRRFCGWLVAEEIIDSNPMAGISPPTQQDKPVPVIADTTLSKLLKACSGKTLADRRDAAMFRVLIDCGLRVSELCGMTLEGLDMDQGMLMVTGKGRKIRPVYFSSRTGQALDRYVRVRATSRHANHPSLWLGERGPFTPDGVRERLNVRCAMAGIEHINPHRFRHTFAHDYLANGGQERSLMRLAGWSSSEMLSRYGASAADARAAAEARRLGRGNRI